MTGMAGGLQQNYWDSDGYFFFYSSQLTQRFANSDGETIMNVNSSHPVNTWYRCWIKVDGTTQFRICRGTISSGSLTTEFETSWHPLNSTASACSLSIGTMHHSSSGNASSIQSWSYPGEYDNTTNNGTWIRGVNTHSGLLTNAQLALKPLPTSAP